MESLKKVLIALLVLAALAGAGFCIYQLTQPNLSSREGGLIGFIVALLAFIGSWFISHFYAVGSIKKTGEQLIDTIAQQSSEKIINLSTQLWRLERFCHEALRDARDQTHPDTSVLIFDNRVYSAIHTLRGLRAENNTFLSDWKGVVSSEVRNQITSQIEAMSDIIEGIEEIEVARAGGDERRLEGAYEKIARGEAVLPALLRPAIHSAPPPAVRTSQQIHSSSESLQEGILVLDALRPVSFLTGSGKLAPDMLSPPDITAKITDGPYGWESLSIWAKTGTIFDFNVHLRTTEHNIPIPLGNYTVEYQAICAGAVQSSDGNGPNP